MLKAITTRVAKLFGRGATPEPSVPLAAYEQLKSQNRQLQATYDAVRHSDEFKNYWANADQLDADSAHSKAVRHPAIARARYEINNNGFSDGIAQTYATDLVGLGPTLRMKSGSEGFNRMVEAEWDRWCKAVKFRRKLWCMAHAKHSDGEAFAVLRRNPNLRHPLGLDLQLYEAEQITTPNLPFSESGYIDGIKFDEFGNPLFYDIAHEHPGATGNLLVGREPEHVPARYVLHWFKLRRPGQHRAVPEMMSTLNTGAASRRWREANLSAAERAALLTLMIKTQQSPETVLQPCAAFSTMDVEKGMMNFLPKGWEPAQLDGKFPTSTHAEFQKSLVNEQARPKSMPYNKAACDSSSYNYASGRLDHQTYYGSLDVDRADCDEEVLDNTFDVWFEWCVFVFGWLGGDPMVVSESARAHAWDWPKHRQADVEAEANSNRTRLESGQVGIGRLYSDAGLDFEDEVEEMATSYGVSSDELRQRLLDKNLPEPAKAEGQDGETFKDQLDAYSVAVRAGSITPQIEDEEQFRRQAGLPAMSEAAKQAWKRDKGTRRPITLTDTSGQTRQPFGQSPANSDATNDESGDGNPSESAEAALASALRNRGLPIPPLANGNGHHHAHAN